MTNLERPGRARKVVIEGVSGHIIITTLDGVTPHDIFIRGFGRYGSTMQGWADSFAMMLSFHVQGEGDLAQVAGAFIEKRIEPYGSTDDESISFCSSMQDYILRLLASWFDLPALRAVYERRGR